MKTKEEILKMSKKELNNYKWHEDLNIANTNTRCSDCSDCFRCYGCSDCSNCSDCFRCYGCTDCSDCTDCSGCSDCYRCRYLRNKQYCICNVQFTKEEYFSKLESLKV